MLQKFMVTGFGYLIGDAKASERKLEAITESMTNTLSLYDVTKAAKSSIPALGNAGTYTFANVLLTFAGTVMTVI